MINSIKRRASLILLILVSVATQGQFTNLHNWYVVPAINIGLHGRSTTPQGGCASVNDYNGYGVQSGYRYISGKGWIVEPYINLLYDAWKLERWYGGQCRPGEFDMHHPYQLTLGTGVLGGKRLIEDKDWGLDVIVGPYVSYAVAAWMPYGYRRWHLWVQGGLQANYQRVFLRVSYSLGLLKRKHGTSWLRGRDVDLISLVCGWRF